MTQEEKDLVLIDVCGRLPYDLKIKDEYGDYINVNLHNANIEHLIDRVVSGLDKMVLRPMSSMTDEEEKQFQDVNLYELPYMVEGLDWLNAHHFDYRGLITYGLALEAPEGMYNN